MHRSPRPFLRLLLIAAAALIPSAGVHARTVLKAGNATVWKYFDDGAEPGAGWQKPGFDDSKWKSGKAPLGVRRNGAGDRGELRRQPGAEADHDLVPA